MNKKDFIIDFLNKNKLKFDVNELNEDEINIIYDLYKNNVKIYDEKILNSNCLLFYGIYYKNIEKNYDLMKKYYLMTIENDKNNSDAMYDLGHYYQYIEKNYKLMKKYYLMAIENDIFKNIFKNIKNIDNKLIKLKIYLAILPKINDKEIKIEIETFLNKNKHWLKIYEKNLKLKNKIKKLVEENLHLKYQPGGNGYFEAESHFNECLKEMIKN